MRHIEMIQRRPGMYVGDTRNGDGLHNLLYAPLDNAITEVLLGHATQVRLNLCADGSCVVTDDGRGMLIDPPEGTEYLLSYPEIVLTQLHAGPRFHGSRPSTITNTGLAPVNALADRLELRVVRQDAEYIIGFEAGELARPLIRLPRSERRLELTHGTELAFLPSAEVFSTIRFDRVTIERTLEDVRSRTGVVVALVDHRPGADG